MTSGIEYALDQISKYCADDSHGYELGVRDYSFGTDCSGLARLYACLVESENISYYPDMSTRNMRDILAGRGWKYTAYTSYDAAPRGAMILTNRRGHVVIKQSDFYIFGAEGNWDCVAGDSSGTEVCRRAPYEYDWDWVIWWPYADGTEDYKPASLEVDGYWGRDTSIALANILGTPADGIVSSQSNYWQSQNPGLTSGWEWVESKYAVGSQLIGAIQNQCGIDVDYLIGPKTINAIISRFGSGIQDGQFDKESPTIKALQTAANDRRF